MLRNLFINVGIGLVNPSSKLEVVGAVTATSFVTLSDERLKTDIENIPNATEILNQLRGVSFKWKKDNAKTKNADIGQQFGCVAQEVKAVIPQIVSKNETGYIGFLMFHSSHYW